jgi:Uma2 family endonuclease
MVTSALLTTEAYLAQPEQYDRDGNRIKDELIAGEIVLVAPPSRQHDLLKTRVGKAFTLFLAANPQLGLESCTEVAYAVSRQNVLVPDVSLIAERRFLESGSRIIDGAPDLAVEVVSPSDTAAHMKAKVSAYLTNGSKSVWVFYPNDKSVVIHSTHGSREVKDGDILEDEILPGFSEPVARFFEGL